MDNNETDNFLDETENKKHNNAAIVIILYVLVIILAALMVFGLKNQKKIVKDNLTKDNQSIRQNNNSKDQNKKLDDTSNIETKETRTPNIDDSNSTDTLEQSINTINKEKEDMKESVTDLETSIQEYLR